MHTQGVDVNNKNERQLNTPIESNDGDYNPKTNQQSRKAKRAKNDLGKKGTDTNGESKPYII